MDSLDLSVDTISRDCVSNHNVHGKGLLLARKLLKQVFKWLSGNGNNFLKRGERYQNHIQNHMTMPWLKKKTNRQIIVHNTQEDIKNLALRGLLDFLLHDVISVS